jgi:actin-related protein 2
MTSSGACVWAQWLLQLIRKGMYVQLARETTCLSMTYTLPDGQTISIGPERFWAPEVLFKPSLVHIESEGLCDAIHECIASLPIDTRLGMYEAILLSGGTLMLPGASTRIESELSVLYCDRTLQVCKLHAGVQSALGMR